MFLLSVLNFIYALLCLFVVLIILIQRGKGNMGLGNVGGNNQMLFGSSGGQDIFQKITWVCCALLLVGSLVLSLSRGKGAASYRVNYQMPQEEALPGE
ncbi:preprotein translocase subunit SecG [Candidatus Babeliales bacterium]|nr:preprotein translocase subunit SecG [Candidatus Babeliales bacterium]